MKKTLKVILAAFLLMLPLCTAVSAAEARDITAISEITGTNIKISPITDGSTQTFSGGESVTLTVTAPEDIGGIYLQFRKTPSIGESSAGDISCNGFLSEFADLSGAGARTFTVSYERAEICELKVFSKGEIPGDVQRWRSDSTDTDLLLLATHSDDDQLFFAGLLPYYAGHVGARVRVAYFVSHHDAPSRLHELLAGLWECGVEYYPEIGIFPDAYSESLEGARRNLEYSGFTYKDVMEYQRMLLEKYRPQVVVLHDFAGEYGHGQHIINTQSFIDELDTASGDKWKPKKVYVHLYGENRIELPIDTPLDAFGGLTAFQVSQKAFGHHKSQHWTWFRRWIYGSAGQITNSSQITSYNPRFYGLYSTEVGEDTGKNDIFENITLYAELERAEAERIERERVLEEHKKIQAELNAIAIESFRQALEAIEPPAAGSKGNGAVYFIAVLLALLAAAAAVIIVKGRRK